MSCFTISKHLGANSSSTEELRGQRPLAQTSQRPNVRPNNRIWITAVIVKNKSCNGIALFILAAT